MRSFLVITSLLFFLSATTQAREIWKGSMPDGMFNTFLELYKKDPAALGRFSGALRNISSKQLNKTFSYLGVTHFSYLHPMTLYGDQLPEIKGTKLSRLSLMAVKGGKMIPLPFQIDEFDKNGLIWIEGYNQVEAEGTPGQWDDFDQLVFMYRDGSRTRYRPQQHGKIDGHILKEIKLSSPRNPPRWLYLVLDNPLRSDADYVNTNLEDGKVESTYYRFDYEPDNLLRINRIAPKAGPHYGENAFGNLKIHLSTGILNKHLRLSLDKDNIHAEPIAVKDGPIRNIMLLHARIWYFGLPTIFDLQLMVGFYEQGINVPTRLALDSIRSLSFLMFFLRQPEANISISFNQLNGARTTFANLYHKRRMGRVDGQMKRFEKRINQTRLLGNWLFMDSNQGWQMFFSNHIPVVPGGMAEQMIKDVKMHLIYQDRPLKNDSDTAKTAPNRLTIGFHASGLPRVLVDMLAAVPSLDFEEMDTLGEALIAIGQSGKDGELDELNGIINAYMTQLMASGDVTSVAQLADMVIKDISRLKLIGLPQDSMDDLIRSTLQNTTKQPNQIRVGVILQEIARLAQERGFAFRDLRYAVMNNSFWMPDWVGEGGPDDFAWQINHPPQTELLPWVPKGQVTKVAVNQSGSQQASETP